MGGSTSTTSKAVILAPSTDDGVDVEYTFAQVGIDEAKVDWGSNCGNCSAVVASFAIREGWVVAGCDGSVVRVLNTNTGQLIVQRVDTPVRGAGRGPDADHPGRALPGAPVRMGFVDPAGRSTGHLFKRAGRGPLVLDGDVVTVTLVDAGAPVVAVRAADFDVRGDEETQVLDATPGPAELRGCRTPRGRCPAWASPRTGRRSRAPCPSSRWSPPPWEAARRPTSPCGCCPWATSTPPVPVTGSVALTLAAGEPGTVVHDLVPATGRSPACGWAPRPGA